MVKIQTEVDGYRGGCDGKEIHRNWMSTAIISISVIRVQCSRQVSGSAINVPDWFLVLLSVRGVVGSLSFEVQGRGCLAQFGPIWTDRQKGGGAKIGIFSWMSQMYGPLLIF